MSTGKKILFALYASGGGLSATLVGYAEGWRYWPLPMIAAAGFDLFLAVKQGTGTQAQSAAASAVGADTAHVAGPHWEAPVSDVRLQSLTPDYDFVFSAIVEWRLVDAAPNRRERANANPGALAVAAIIERAREVAVRERPELHSEAQNRLATTLGIGLPDATGRVEVWARKVSLTVPLEDLERVNRLTKLRKDAELWARYREFERERRSYFAEDVFKSTGSAVIWMLAQEAHSVQDVQRTVQMIGPLARLSAAANETDVPELFRQLAFPPDLTEPTLAEADVPEPVAENGTEFFANGAGPYGGTEPPREDSEELADHVARVIRDFAADSGSELSASFARRLAGTFDSLDQPETAQRFRATFGLREPAHPARPVDPAPGTGSQDPGQDTGTGNGWARNLTPSDAESHLHSADEPGQDLSEPGTWLSGDGSAPDPGNGYGPAMSNDFDPWHEQLDDMP